MSIVKRGDIYYADLSPVVGSEQGGMRPVLIVQNDTGNKHSPTVIAAAITSQTGKARLRPTSSLMRRVWDFPVTASYCLSRYAPSINPDCVSAWENWMTRR